VVVVVLMLLLLLLSRLLLLVLVLVLWCWCWCWCCAINAVHSYRLFYDAEDSDQYSEVELPASKTRYVAKLLDPGVKYRFQVQAFTSAGDGPQSAIVTCRKSATLLSHTSRTHITPSHASRSHSMSRSSLHLLFLLAHLRVGSVARTVSLLHEL
jgi:hypothetical protein